jgi:hypothetical protein
MAYDYSTLTPQFVMMAWAGRDQVLNSTRRLTANGFGQLGLCGDVSCLS